MANYKTVHCKLSEIFLLIKPYLEYYLKSNLVNKLIMVNTGTEIFAKENTQVFENFLWSYPTIAVELHQ